MPIDLEICKVEYLFDVTDRRSALIATPAVSEIVSSLPSPRYREFSELSDDLEVLIVIGGGSLIDGAKLWKHERSPGIKLIAVPSIWGSGAEVSPVAVRNTGDQKEIHVDPSLIPDKACFWPGLAASIPEPLARYACGDAWSHAIEGFLSPLANDELRKELAAVIQEMLELPIANDPSWFGPSARACAGQARSGVGLVHGIAHTLEGILRREYPGSGWGHARLCSQFLWPVMEFNNRNSARWLALSNEYDIDSDGVFSKLQQLHEPEAYNQALPFLEEYWMNILKDPCSRTNSCLVRPAGKTFFTEQFKS